MASSSRRSFSASAAMPMNSLPRWLISITDMPLPRQSVISSPARARTSAGSIAGPALKLKMRDILVDGGWGCFRGRHLGVAVGLTVAVAAVSPVAIAAVAVAEVALLDAL